MKVFGASGNAFKVPVKFLLDPKGRPGGAGFSVGLLLLAAGIGGGALTFRAGMARWAKGCGGLALLLATMYVGQMQRALGTTPGAPSLFKTVGFGCWWWRSAAA